MAVLYELMGRKRDAKTATKQGLALAEAEGKTLAGAYLALAETLLPLNPRNLVEACLQLEVDKGGTDPEAARLLLCRASLLLQQHELDGAEATLGALLAAQPSNAHAHEKVGHALLLKGEPGPAAAAYEKALKHAPQPPTQVLLLLGRLCLQASDWTRAKELFLQACRLAPT